MFTNEWNTKVYVQTWNQLGHFVFKTEVCYGHIFMAINIFWKFSEDMFINEWDIKVYVKKNSGKLHTLCLVKPLFWRIPKVVSDWNDLWVYTRHKFKPIRLVLISSYFFGMKWLRALQLNRCQPVTCWPPKLILIPMYASEWRGTGTVPCPGVPSPWPSQTQPQIFHSKVQYSYQPGHRDHPSYYTD